MSLRAHPNLSAGALVVTPLFCLATVWHHPGHGSRTHPAVLLLLLLDRIKHLFPAVLATLHSCCIALSADQRGLLCLFLSAM
jgi:hypothetical protein